MTIDYIQLTSDVIFEESPGNLKLFKSGSFGKLLNEKELQDVLDCHTKNQREIIFKEFDKTINERGCPAIVEGYLCMLNQSEFYELNSVPRMFAISNLKS